MEISHCATSQSIHAYLNCGKQTSWRHRPHLQSTDWRHACLQPATKGASNKPNMYKCTAQYDIIRFLFLHIFGKDSLSCNWRILKHCKNPRRIISVYNFMPGGKQSGGEATFSENRSTPTSIRHTDRCRFAVPMEVYP